MGKILQVDYPGFVGLEGQSNSQLRDLCGWVEVLYFEIGNTFVLLGEGWRLGEAVDRRLEIHTRLNFGRLRLK